MIELHKGQLSVIAIVIAIIVSGFGGYILNAKNIDINKTNFNYITDISGQFEGTKQDIPVDYNPRENITGYYPYDPTDPKSNSQYKVPQISYDSPALPNNYPYTNQQPTYEFYDIQIKSNHATNNMDKGSYNVVITRSYTDEQGESKKETKMYQWTSNNDLTKYCGLDDHDELWGVDQSRIFIYNHPDYRHNYPHVISIAELLDHVPWLQGVDATFSKSGGGDYPCFVQGLSNEKQSDFGVDWYTYKQDEFGAMAQANTSTNSVIINGLDYALNSGWFVFGNKNDREYSISAVTQRFNVDNMYVDPNKGISPTSTSGKVVEFYDIPHFTDSFKVNVSFDRTGDWFEQKHITFNAKYSVDYLDEEGNIHRAYLMEVYSHRTWGADVSGDCDTTVWSLNQDGSRLSEIGKWQWVLTTRDYNIEIKVEGNRCYFTLDKDGGTESRDCEVIGLPTLHKLTKFYYELTNYSDDHQWQYIKLTDTQTGNHSWDTRNAEGRNVARDIMYYEEIHKEFDQTSEVTYWYNGYNNSTIGMIIQMTDDTTFNVMLHDPTTLEDYWVYGDQAKQSIGFFIDDAGMQWAGYIDNSGTQHKSVQIGVCKYVYFELTIVNNQVHLWQSPVYNFTNFTTFTPVNLVDVTNQISPVFDSLPAKSITEISYYVPFIHTGQYDPETGDEILKKFSQPRQLVTKTVLLLDGGGLYVQDGKLTFEKSFPSYNTSEFIVNAVVHPGDSMTIKTNNTELIKIYNDGVDKWINPKDGKSYDWWELKIYFSYNDSIYLDGGTQLLQGHVYLQWGKWAVYQDIGEMQHENNDDTKPLTLTITMDGVWAFSTQYYEGVLETGKSLVFDTPGTWHWSKEETIVVFSGIMIAVQSILMYYRGYNLLDLLIMGGQVALAWIML